MITVKIPPGWHRLRKGTILRKGDRFSPVGVPVVGGWLDATRIGLHGFKGLTYIRKSRNRPRR